MADRADIKLSNGLARKRVKAAIQALISADSTADLQESLAQMRVAVVSLKQALKVIEAELPKKRKAPAKKSDTKKPAPKPAPKKAQK